MQTSTAAGSRYDLSCRSARNPRFVFNAIRKKHLRLQVGVLGLQLPHWHFIVLSPSIL